MKTYPILIKAIQELSDQNKEMKAEIEELKKK
jgi:cell division septum initiation protein DivIVA